MSYISEALWETEFESPMPVGTTYADFALKRELKWIDQGIRDKTKEIAELKKLEKPGLKDYLATQEEQLYELYFQKRRLETEGIEGVRR